MLVTRLVKKEPPHQQNLTLLNQNLRDYLEYGDERGVHVVDIYQRKVCGQYEVMIQLLAVSGGANDANLLCLLGRNNGRRRPMRPLAAQT